MILGIDGTTFSVGDTVRLRTREVLVDGTIGYCYRIVYPYDQYKYDTYSEPSSETKLLNLIGSTTQSD